MAFDHLKQQVIDSNDAVNTAQEQLRAAQRHREKVYASALDQGLTAREVGELTGRSGSLIRTIAKKGRQGR